MCGKFWDLLEIVANSRHYLHTTEMRLCGYLNNINIRTRDGKEQNMNDGNITAWYDYLSKNRIKEVYFRAELEFCLLFLPLSIIKLTTITA